MAITFSEVPTNAAASAVFVEQEAVNRGTGSPVIPQKILVPGQYNTGFSPTVNTPQLITSKEDAWTRYGRGSMLSRMIERIIGNAAGVPVYALPVADDGSAVAATGTIVITGTATAVGTIAVYVEGVRIPVAVAVGDAPTDIGDAIVTAVNANFDLPVTAANATGTVTFTVRWKGESGNQIKLEVNRLDSDSALPAGVTAATVTDIGDVVAGATDPVLTTAFGNLGNTWYTIVSMPYNADTPLDAMEAAGDVRIDAGVKRPFAGLVGYTGTYADFLTALGSRNSAWTSFVPVHGSPSSAYMIAATAAAIFGRYQQATPGRPVKTLTLPGVIAGTTNDLTYTQRDAAVKAGGSYTVNQEDGTVIFGDLCTTKTTESSGAETEDWRFTIIIPNLQFKIYALEQTFLASPFDRAVVLAEGTGRGPTYGIRPSTVKGYAIKLVDDWIDRGLSTDRDTIVEGITSEIDGTNAGRINLLIPDTVAAGLRIVAVKLEWAFLV